LNNSLEIKLHYLDCFYTNTECKLQMCRGHAHVVVNDRQTADTDVCERCHTRVIVTDRQTADTDVCERYCE